MMAVSTENFEYSFLKTVEVEQNLNQEKSWTLIFFIVHVFWEGHKTLQNLHLTFDWHYIGQNWGEDFAKFCGLLRIYEL